MSFALASSAVSASRTSCSAACTIAAAALEARAEELKKFDPAFDLEKTLGRTTT